MDSHNNPQRPDGRLDSWKTIGAFFGRDERTVKRWEGQRGLPIHRVPGAGRTSVYAYASGLNEWLKTADTQTPLPNLPHDSAGSLAVVDSRTPAISPAPFQVISTATCPSSPSGRWGPSTRGGAAAFRFEVELWGAPPLRCLHRAGGFAIGLKLIVAAENH
jgi:hypothetical protein